MPIYPLNYSWHQTQREQLLRDILRISDSDQMHSHFMGSLVYFRILFQELM